ncbi:hypothetical protein CspeluHIS016_0100220 [Cutaneotrichosporon spelunceum]|uniref:Uncharacterized protein n=1 Tax=Cutaneotrichosporon spelunceum TaxID=1672016 RepID=A0AAD3Y7E3_9TREE|nr:hypothetical protein CspeluHIS016_0100220 [Cutaneotrichosporon spelunceum]
MFQSYHSPWPLGHTPLEREKVLLGYQYDLERDLGELQACNVFPVERYLDILDQMMRFIPHLNEIEHPLLLFLSLVQEFIGRTKARISMWGMALSPDEVHCITYYANQWLQRRGGALDMGPPEAKLVLYSLRELESYNEQALAIRMGSRECAI